jgi:cytidyltransferase-like protein
MPKKVLVSGCYDLLHSGHVAFFNEASRYGDLYVALGSDKTVYDLKGRTPINSEEERLYMVKSVASVKDAFVSTGSGMLDFENELRQIDPDIFVVNQDGNIPAKRQLCAELSIEYVVLERTPHADLTPRSTTSLRDINRVPYRVDIAGGWLDQPFVSKHHPGPVITASIEPTIDFNERSGMATSTRNAAIDLWGPRLPTGDPERLAKLLFCWDNPPGTKMVSGSQDSIGIAMPGLNKSNYAGDYWPESIDMLRDELAMQFVEQSMHLIPLDPRTPEYNPLENTHITPDGARRLAEAADTAWQAVIDRDLAAFGQAFRESFEAQIAMFPRMVNPAIHAMIDEYRDRALGWKLSGAGGGGYLIFIAEKPIEQSIHVVIRRESD